VAKILMVEDEAMVRFALKVLLESHGHEIIEASNGREGVAKLGDEPVDVVITDVLMPEADGTAVIKAARQLQPEPRIIAISGGGARLPASLCLTLSEAFGADRVLFKPFDNEELLAAVGEVLESRAAS